LFRRTADVYPRVMLKVLNINDQLMSVMTLLDAHLEQISLCAASIAELPYDHFKLLISRR
jgi:hypothetical protein